MKSPLKSNRIRIKHPAERDREELLSVSEVARYLKVAQRTVFRMMQRKELPAVNVGRLWRIQWGWLQEWIASIKRESLPAVAVPSPAISSLTKELSRELKSLYGSRLKGTYLYGSYARGEESSDSDLDVLAVLNDFTEVGKELARVAPLSSRLSLAYGIPVALMFVREQDFHSRETPFLINVRREARPLAA